MPKKLHDFWTTDVPALGEGKNVAGFILGNKFKYVVSENVALPAAVNALQLCNKRGRVYTNSADALKWLKHYPALNIKSSANLVADNGDGAKSITPERVAVLTWPKQIESLGFTGPLAGGGLYAAASSVMAQGKAYAPASGKDKALVSALRYYMLAAYSLVDISAEESFAGLKNYVGALLVSDAGEILSAGINTGAFRHAEVSMLLSYFRKNPGVTKIPERSIIFSTLTPCRGCTGYLELSKSASSVIYFGQMDTGKDGKVGAKISKQLSDQTKAPQGVEKEKFSIKLEDEVGAVVTLATCSKINKTQIDTGLSNCMGEGSIATQIGHSADAKKVLRSASEALIHKVLKDRPADAEQDVKHQVLQYVCSWLGTVKLGA
ncbi:hypothetical protein [Dyella mobilis]|uniref:CMP/dCMP-type deaminase domain-containing protein n=1 Tax=Dyella mobilis TaxID=1849582 RepID=A0ABS2K9Y0_9GAMM|nr:hypothetical protein [Dyella mobilis]MBM7127959.1 hypothetical protein [Dyella mobilis]GLQ99219.1 hypothetical protein GCM10007863_36390 [Dyella mobilis]